MYVEQDSMKLRTLRMRIKSLNGFFAFDLGVIDVWVIKNKMNNGTVLQNRLPAQTIGTTSLLLPTRPP